jgi:hypothetical protein
VGWKVIISPSACADLEGIVRCVAAHNTDAAAWIGFYNSPILSDVKENAPRGEKSVDSSSPLW